jgi:hypothetical protein
VTTFDTVTEAKAIVIAINDIVAVLDLHLYFYVIAVVTAEKCCRFVTLVNVVTTFDPVIEAKAIVTGVRDIVVVLDLPLYFYVIAVVTSEKCCHLLL